MALGIIIRDGTNTARTITTMVVRDGGNVARTITEAWVRDTNNVPRLVFNPSGSASLAVTVTPEFLGAFASPPGTGVATTGTTTATGSGGVAPYTYAWTLDSYTAGAPPTASDSALATTSFTQTGIPSMTTESAVWICTVTDDDGNTAESDPVTTYFSDTA